MGHTAHHQGLLVSQVQLHHPQPISSGLFSKALPYTRTELPPPTPSVTSRVLSLTQAWPRSSQLPTGWLASTLWTHLFGAPLALGKCCWGWDELSMGLVNTPLKEKKQPIKHPERSQGAVQVGVGGGQGPAITYRMI